jgi:hypothetical protein
MNRTDIGRAIGTDALEEMRVVALRFWDEWAKRYPELPEERQRELMTELSLLTEQARGNAVITHCPEWTTIDYDPSDVGLDLPQPSLITQWGDDGFVAAWWKSGDAPTDWVKILGVSDLTLSTEDPLPNGIANPGDTTSKKATAQRHVHPADDNAGGFLYLVGPYDEIPLTLYGNGVVGFNLDLGMQATPSGVFSVHRTVTTGGNLGGY